MAITCLPPYDHMSFLRTLAVLCLFFYAPVIWAQSTAVSTSDTVAVASAKQITRQSNEFPQITRQPRFKILPLPVLGFSPETNLMLGAVAFFTIRTGDDSLTRPTLAKIEYDYTLRKQSMLDIEWTFFAPQERWMSRGRFYYMKYPDYYYGIGSQVTEDDRVSYDSRRIISHFSLLRNLGESLFTGLQIKYNFNDRVSYQSDNPNHDYPELVDGSSYSLGYVLVKDKRNHLRTPTKGYYAYMDVAYGYNTLKGSFTELNLDARYYHTFARRFTFAARFYQEFNFGNPSYFDMALMGGDRFVRGFFHGKYRDKHLSTVQTELRAPLFWRIGGAIFAGASDVYGEGASKPLRNLFFNYGAGVRFLIDRKENASVRIDYAKGSHGNSGLYLSFGENF